MPTVSADASQLQLLLNAAHVPVADLNCHCKNVCVEFDREDIGYNRLASTTIRSHNLVSSPRTVVMALQFCCHSMQNGRHATILLSCHTIVRLDGRHCLKLSRRRPWSNVPLGCGHVTRLSQLRANSANHMLRPRHENKHALDKFQAFICKCREPVRHLRLHLV